MINIKGTIDDIFTIISKKQTLFEFLLNLSFVLIIFVIIMIFYWDSINRSIINNNRCKVSIDNSDLTYNLKVYNSGIDNANIFNISYDNTTDKNIKIDCACPVGETLNKFEFPYYNNINKKDDVLNKYCYCAKDYQYTKNTGLTNLDLDGDAFLVDYYKGLFNYYANGNSNMNQPIMFPSS